MFAHATASAPARVFVIAELGVNHDGSVDRALHLVAAAADTGADAVKLQLFDAAMLLSNQARLAAYQASKPPAPPGDRVGMDTSSAGDPPAEPGAEGGGREAVLRMLDALQLDVDAMRAVRDAARQRGLRFVVTPFSLELMDALASLDVDAVKIASPDAVNRPLLEAAAALGKPLIVSTGTCELDELGFVAELLRAHKSGGCLLQCVSSYPTPKEHAALGGIAALRERFDLPVGYSDHTTDVWAGALAVAAGACVLEKHLTYDTSAAGPDHAASLTPIDMARYVHFARRAATMLGPVTKARLSIEGDVHNVSRQSVCAVRDLAANHVISRDDVTVKRPGVGIPAARLDEVVGRTLRRAVRANDLLRDEDLK